MTTVAVLAVLAIGLPVTLSHELSGLKQERAYAGLGLQYYKEPPSDAHKYEVTNYADIDRFRETLERKLTSILTKKGWTKVHSQAEIKKWGYARI